jgi:heptosyltransferase-2
MRDFQRTVQFGHCLVSLKSYIGDCVMALPLFEELEAHFAQVTFLAGGALQQVICQSNPNRRVVPAAKSKHPSAVWKEAQWMRSERFDAAFIVNHSFRSALTANLARIPVRVGHATELRSWALTHPVPYDQGEFESQSSLDLVRTIGVEAIGRMPELVVTATQRRRGQELANGAKIGIQPGARFGAKQIPIPVCIEVAQQLAAEGYSICLLGGNDEAQFAEPIEAAIKGSVENLVGKSSISETLGVLANLDLMIGSDTGLMHMAAAVDCPSITLFGPTPIEKWGHNYGNHVAIQAPGGSMDNIDASAILEIARRRLRG